MNIQTALIMLCITAMGFINSLLFMGQRIHDGVMFDHLPGQSLFMTIASHAVIHLVLPLGSGALFAGMVYYASYVLKHSKDSGNG